MSGLSQPVLPAQKSVPRRSTRPLRVVSSPRRRRPRLLYGVVAIAGALLISGAQLTLSIFTTTSTYEISSLTSAKRELGLQAQVLNDELAGMYSPQYLATSATGLGMVIGAPPSYLRLSDGAIIGSGASTSTSTVDATGAVTVPNELLKPTNPAPNPVPSAVPEAETPPVLGDEGIPAPQTH